MAFLCSCFGKPSELEAGPSCSGGPDLAPYRALRSIGRGAVGEVFLARHAGDGQLYAVKTVPLNAPSWRIELLKREERTYAALATDAGAHVGLLRPCRMQLLHDRLCLVTEWASGGTLSTFLSGPKYSRGVSEQLAVFMMRQLIGAVEKLHVHRVAYRDIKLDNILLDLDTFGKGAPRLLLADFGTCKAWEEGEEGCLTQTFMGTPGYMAPQVLRLLSLHRDLPDNSRHSLPLSEMDDSAAMSASSSDGSSSSLHSVDGAGEGGPVSRAYDAVKADIYSLGAILMYMLFKELPYGFDKFARLLPPREALSVLWQLESQHSWREAAGSQLGTRRVSPEALDLLDQMLQADEGRRIDIGAIKAHPWMAQKLPKRYESALEQLAKEQLGLDLVRRALQDRSQRRASIGSAPFMSPGAAAVSSAFAGSGPRSGASCSSRPMSGVESALETLFSYATDAAALAHLKERGASLFVDVCPDGVASAWELGVQTENVKTGRPLRRSTSGGVPDIFPPPPSGFAPAAPASSVAAAAAAAPAAVAAAGWARPTAAQLAAAAAFDPDGCGAPAGDDRPCGPLSVAGRSDSATSTEMPSAALGAPEKQRAVAELTAAALGAAAAAAAGGPRLGY